MNNSSLRKAGILALILVALSVLSWEVYLRGKGFETTFNDDPSLWTHQRDRVYGLADKTTVFIGSSRIKFDLDILTWKSITGDDPVQLACVGSNPIPVLENLADDNRFTGRLIVDVTEGLFFSSSPNNNFRPAENMKYFKERTPAQRASFHINRLLESNFVFLDKEWLSLNACLGNIPLNDRQGVYNFHGFPADFGRVKFNRQEYMTDKFSSDTVLQNKVKGIWYGFMKASKEPPASGAKLDSILNVVKVLVDKIKARGGQVLFVRTPSSGAFLQGESRGFPREKYWERILATTKCPGIHFADYPAISNFICPEFSHLSQPDAIVFTKEFIRILNQEKGWQFPKLPVPAK
ncbi:MAG: hypothetical protein WAT20_09490 [Ferruginibacter sp.]|nr:hypothetical protein [Chitinophagaceae bacterium]